MVRPVSKYDVFDSLMHAVQKGCVPAPKARLYSVSRTLARPKGASFPPVRVKNPSISVIFIHDTGWTPRAIHFVGLMQFRQ